MRLNKEAVAITIKKKVKDNLESHSKIKAIAASEISQNGYVGYDLDMLLRELFQKSKKVEAFLQAIEDAVNTVYLNNDQIRYFYHSKMYFDFPEMEQFIQEVTTCILDNYSYNQDYNFYCEKFDSKPNNHTSNGMSDYLKKRYEDIDARQQDDHVKLRRFDSFARLLTLEQRLSVCTSVAIHKGLVYIALNASSNKVQAEIATCISKRIHLIKHYIENILQLDIDDFEEQKEHLFDSLRKNLIQHGGCHLRKETLAQAINKFTYAVIYDQTTFSKDIVKVFRDNLIHYKLLLPKMDGNNPVILKLDEEQIKNIITQENEAKKAAYSFQEKPDSIYLNIGLKNVSVSDIHAEQMIAYDLIADRELEQYNAEEKLHIGVSKLCCQTCYNNLSETGAIKIRGCHGVIYESTVSLISNNLVVKHDSTPVKGPTEAINSPADSAKKRSHEQREEGGQSSHRENFFKPSTARRALFKDNACEEKLESKASIPQAAGSGATVSL